MSARPDMPFADIDPRILGYLGRALSLEFSAAQQYSSQACLAATWGLADAAERLKKESRGEVGHAERIIARMLALGTAPNASQLRPAQLGRNLRDLLRADQAFERELVELYGDAVRYCAQIGDLDNRAFFQALFEEESEHDRELAAWLEKLEGAGF